MIIVRKGAMGDVIMLTPAIRELRLQYPKEFIGIQTDCVEVFLNNPYVNVVSANLSKPNEKIIVLDGAYEKNFDRHPVDVYSEILNIKLSSKRTEIFHSYNDRNCINALLEKMILKKDLKTIILHFGLTWVPLQPEKFDELIDKLYKKYNLILIGQRNHTEYYPKNNSKVIDLTNIRLSTQQIAWIIEKADLYFGTDTGIMHVAGTTSTPICCCFGYINPEYRKPFRDKNIQFVSINASQYCDTPFCAEKRKKKTQNGDFAGVDCNKCYACAQGITSEMMFDAIEKILE